MPLRGVALLVLIVGSIPICFFRPFYGILLWVVLAFLNPQSFTWTAFYAFPWAEAVAIPTMLGMLVYERAFGRLMSREVGLLVLLWLWFTFTTLISVNHPVFMHHSADTWERWIFVSKILLMTICMIPIVNSFERLRYLILTIAACFAFYVVKAFPFIIATGGAYRLYGPERSMIGDNTDFGLALNMTLPLYFFLSQTEKKRWLKWLLWTVFLLTIPATFFTYSRGALVGLAAVFVVLVLQSRRRVFALVPVLALGLAVALYFAPEKWQERMNPTLDQAVDNSAQIRLKVWTLATGLAADYPITGGGFGTFTEQIYLQYWPGPVTNIHGPHSVYFQVLGEHGYVGLGLYLLVVLSCLLTARRLRKEARVRDDRDIRLYALMLQASLIGFLIPGFFLGRAYFDYYFTIVACITILDRVARERWLPVAQPAAVVRRVPAAGIPHRRPAGLRQPALRAGHK